MRFSAPILYQRCVYGSYYEKIGDTVTCIDDEIPFDIPNGWALCRFGDVFKIGSSKRVLQSEWKKTGVPFYRAREIAKLSIEGIVDNDLFVSEEHYNKLKNEYGVPKAGDLMVTGVGTIGKVYVVGENDRFYYKDASVLCFENRSGIIFPEYAKNLIESSFVQSQIFGNTYGTTVNTITISAANKYLCIIPPVNEQNLILQQIQQLTSVIEVIEASLN